MFRIILIVICFTQAGFAASNFFNFLTEEQKQQVWDGQQVNVFKYEGDYAKLTSFVMISKGVNNLNARKAAAIFWDLPGQASYLDFGSFGLKEFKVGLGKGTASVIATVTSVALTANGPLTQVYPQQNSLYRFNNEPGCGNDAYMITWNSTDPARPPVYSGLVSLSGMAAFEPMPDKQNVLMVYQNIGVLSEAGHQDESTANLLKAQAIFLTSKHRERLEKGAAATKTQEKELNSAVGCN